MVEKMKPYVYAITDGEAIKIGVARKPHKRLKALSTGNAKKLQLIGYFDGGFELEHELHKRFQKVRENGEWLHVTQELVEYLNEKILNRHITFDGSKVQTYTKINNINDINEESI